MSTSPFTKQSRKDKGMVEIEEVSKSTMVRKYKSYNNANVFSALLCIYGACEVRGTNADVS